QPPRTFGDVRYNFVRYLNDVDNQVGFIGVANFIADYRTGEILKSTVIVNESNLKDAYVQHIDAYLKSIGASDGLDNPTDWKTGGCTAGETKPIVNDTLIANHNKSTLFNKMQEYMHKPAGQYGNLGPIDFVNKNPDADFLKVFYAWLPYQM